jgi:cell division septation protein DedD
LRQYMRMLDAMVEVPPAKADRPDRSVAVAWLALAASAAAIVVVLLTTPLRVARGPEPGQHAIGPGPSAGAPTAGLVVSTPAAKPAVRPPLPERVQGRPLARPSGTLQRSARAPRPAAPASGRPASAGYAVGFGEFASHAAAEITMHFVRGKGYLVYVTRTGDAFQVATRPYRTRAQAERLASALQAIGLPARTFVAVTPVL